VVDLETFSKDVHDPNNKIFCIGVALSEKKAFIIPLRHYEALKRQIINFFIEGVQEKVIEELRRLFSYEKLKIIGHNFKFDALVLLRDLGVDVMDKVYADTLIYHYLLKEIPPHDLKTLITLYTPFSNYYKEMKEIFMSKKEKWYIYADFNELYQYCAYDCCSNYYLWKELDRRIKQLDLWQKNLSNKVNKLIKEHRKLNKPYITPYYTYFQVEKLKELEMEHYKILFEMEKNGLPFSKSYIRNLKEKVEKEIEEKQNELSKLARKRINWNSSQQISKLFKELGIDSPKKTPKGSPSYDEEALKILAENGIELARKLLEYRKLLKNYTTFVVFLENYSDRIKPTKEEDIVRLSCNINRAGTKTGRISTSKPAFHEIPRDNLYRNMVQAEEGWLIVSVDYSMADLRCLAGYSNCKRMIEAFNSGVDFHTLTASLIFNKDFEDVTTEERSIAKCFHPDVEVLTRKGWVKLRDYNGRDEIIQAVPIDKVGIKLEWAKPTYFELKKNHTKKLCRLYNESIDIEVTPDHRMLYQTTYGYFRTTTPSKFVKCFNKFYCAGLLEGGLHVDNDIIRLLVAIQADGNLVLKKKVKDIFFIRFGFRRKRKLRRLIQILDKLKIDYKISKIGKKYSYFNVTVDKKAYHLVKDFLDLNKNFTWKLLDLSLENRLIFLEELQYWDGCKYYRWRMHHYDTTNKHNADIVQAVASISNRKSSILKRRKSKECHKDLFSVSIKQHCYAIRSRPKYKERYHTGLIAILSVPSTFVLIRSKDKTLITGQSINFSIAYLTSAYGLAQRLNISVKEAQDFIDRWFQDKPEVKYFINVLISQYDKVEEGKEAKFINVFGRMRRVQRVRKYYEDKFTGKRKLNLEYSHIIRQIVNFYPQSTVADALMISLIRLKRKLIEKELKSFCKFLLTRHDELLLEVKKEKVDEICEIVKWAMEFPIPFANCQIVIPVDFTIDKMWKKE